MIDAAYVAGLAVGAIVLGAIGHAAAIGLRRLLRAAMDAWERRDST